MSAASAWQKEQLPLKTISNPDPVSNRTLRLNTSTRRPQRGSRSRHCDDCRRQNCLVQIVLTDIDRLRVMLTQPPLCIQGRDNAISSRHHLRGSLRQTRSTPQHSSRRRVAPWRRLSQLGRSHQRARCGAGRPLWPPIIALARVWLRQTQIKEHQKRPIHVCYRSCVAKD